MKISISSNIKISADEAWKLVKKSSTLLYVTRGLMGFKSLSSNLPNEWQQGNTEKLRIMLFGIIPAWNHQISFKDISDFYNHEKWISHFQHFDASYQNDTNKLNNIIKDYLLNKTTL